MSDATPAIAPTNLKVFRTVGIVGAGQRGAGLAHLCALAGCGVIMCDSEKAAIQTGVALIRERFAAGVRAGKLSGAEAHKLTGGIGITTGLEDFEICDLVIEAITENLAAKQAVFAELSTRVDPDCVLVSASSGWSLAEITAAVTNPSRVVGLKFNIPLDQPPASIEILTRPESGAESVGRLRALLGQVGLVAG